MADTKTKEIQNEIVAEQAGTPTALEIQLDSQKAIARVQAITQTIEGCVKVSIQRTNPKDWVKMTTKDGKESYYLQDTGAQKIRSVWGIYFRDRLVSKENNPDGSITYIVYGKAGSKLLDQLYGETVVDFEGGRSSSDSFFIGKDGTKIFDPLDVRKAALANWEARAVTGLLGMKNFTAGDLRKNGIDPSQVTGFEFKKGAEGGGNTELISDAQRKRLFAISSKANLTEKRVHQYIKEKYGIDSTAQIKRSDYESICNWAQAGGEERQPGEGE